MKIAVTRDSVAAGDDCDAPHFRAFEMEDCASLRMVFKRLESVRYLAYVDGRRHSWTAKINGESVAEFVGNDQNPQPSHLLDESLSKYSRDGVLELHFNYYSDSRRPAES